MTSEYDELLARLEDARRRIPKIGGAGAIYEAELLEVIDAAIAGHRALTEQVVERDAVIEQAIAAHKAGPSGFDKAHIGALRVYEVLSQAPRDALAARDAVRDKTVRATALRDAAAESKLWSSKGLRGRADQEEL